MFRFFKILFLFNISAVLLLSCADSGLQNKDGNLFYTQGLDSTVLPGNNFYQFVNGKTIDDLKKANSNHSFNYFDGLQRKTDSLLFQLVISIGDSKDYPVGSDARKLYQFLATAIDSQKIETQQNLPLQQIKKRIYAVTSKQQLQPYIMEDMLSHSSMFFDLEVRVHPTLVNEAILVAHPHALGIQDVKIYDNQDATSKSARLSYYNFLTLLLMADGQPKSTAEAMAATTLKIEIQLAKYRTQNTLISENVAIGDLSLFQDNINWADEFKQVGIECDSIFIEDVSYFKRCNELFKNISLIELKQYAHTSLIRKAAPYLSKNFSTIYFDFYHNNQNQETWQRKIQDLNQTMPDALAQLYVKHQFNPLDKNKVLDMANQIKWSYAKHIKESKWLSDSSKQKALDKLKSLQVKVGFPEKYLDYVGLNFQQDSLDSHFNHVMLARSFNKKKSFAAIGRISNQQGWLIKPQTVNAKYFLQRNEVVIPAAMLQAPFYQAEADLAYQYGGLGAIIAHEISHAFDIQGTQYGAKGEFSPWLNEAEKTHLIKHYIEIQNQILLTYPAYAKNNFLPQMTSESFADLSALQIAFDALQHDYLQFPEKRIQLKGSPSPEQRFFLAWARLWLDTEAKNNSSSVDHTPPLFRVNGILSNLKPFHQAFSVKPEQSLYKPENKQINLWALKEQ